MFKDNHIILVLILTAAVAAGGSTVETVSVDAGRVTAETAAVVEDGPAAEMTKDSIQIRLKDSSLVQGEAVCLGDIATLAVEDSEMRERLMSLIIARGGDGADHVMVGAFEIRRALVRAGVAPAGIDIFGAGCCRVMLENKSTVGSSLKVTTEAEQWTIDEGSIEQADDDGMTKLAELLNEAVARHSGVPAEKLKIEWRCRDERWLLMRGDESRFSIKPLRQAMLGNVRFEVIDREPLTKAGSRAFDEKDRQVTMVIYGKVYYLCESVVAAKPLSVGDVITDEDVTIMGRRVLSYRQVGLTDIKQVVGQEVAHPIAIGAVIMPRMIRKVILVRRNDTVIVRTCVGQIEISLRGMALAEGGYGDTIAVGYGRRNKTLIRGIITRAGEVRVGAMAPVESGLLTVAQGSGTMKVLEN